MRKRDTKEGISTLCTFSTINVRKGELTESGPYSRLEERRRTRPTVKREREEKRTLCLSRS